jgi:hypothetical protein
LSARPAAVGHQGSSREPLDPLLIGAAFTLLYLTTAPDAVNLDGLGYLKLLPHNFAAGHLLFLPLFRAAIRATALDGLRAGRLLDAVLGGTGLVLVHGIAYRLADPRERRFVAAFTACGLGASYAYFSEANDLETYAASTVALLVTVRLVLSYEERPTVGRALAVGSALAIAVLSHIEHIILSLFVAARLSALPDQLQRRRRALYHAALAVGTGGALTLSAYAYAALYVRGHDLRAAARWVLTAAHGFREGGGPYRLADAVYGLSKSLVYAPYLYEADAPRLIGQFLLGLAPLLALVLLLHRQGRARTYADAAPIVAWVVPYGVLALAFFASDPERWLFVLPPLWLLAGKAAAQLERRSSVLVGVVAYLTALNLACGIWPAHRDDTVRRHATLAARSLREGDLLIFPGHSWDEYVSYFAPARVEPFPLVYYAARDGMPACMERLDRELKSATARGGRVYAIRLFDAPDDDPRGFAELKQLGFPPAEVRALVEARAERGEGNVLVPRLGRDTKD